MRVIIIFAHKQLGPLLIIFGLLEDRLGKAHEAAQSLEPRLRPEFWNDQLK